jgi:hypothetical protein
MKIQGVEPIKRCAWNSWIHIIRSSNRVTSQEGDNFGRSKTTGISHPSQNDIDAV